MPSSLTLAFLILGLCGACAASFESIRFDRVAAGSHGPSAPVDDAAAKPGSPRGVVLRAAAECGALFMPRALGARDPFEGFDWSRHMALFVSLGDRPSAGFGVEIASIEARDGAWFVHVRSSAPAAGSMQATVVTAPFDCVAVPRFDGRIEFVFE